VIRSHHPLAGSDPVHPEGAKPVGSADADRRIQVTIVLRPARLPARHPAGLRALAHASAWPTERVPLTDADFAALNAPPPEAVKAVLSVARQQGLTIVDVSQARHDILVEGPIAVFERAYRVRQLEYEHERGRYRAHAGPLSLPRQLHSLVEGVLGLDTIPHGRPHGRAAAHPSRSRRPLLPRDIAAMYKFPETSSAHGRVAILEFGGGVHGVDLAALRRQARIRVLGIVDGDGPTAHNTPLERRVLLEILRDWRAGVSFERLTAAYGNQLAAFMETVEATMDTEIVAGLVPDAPIDLVFAPACADGWRRAIYAEIGFPYPDSVTGPASRSRTPPSVMSVSWGMTERSWGRMKLQVLHGTLQAAVRRDTTVCCSTGDFGSQNSPQPGAKRSVNYPATSTWALACGGTALVHDAGQPREVGWLESLLGSKLAGGGGMSGHFTAPRFQAGIVKPDPGDTWLAGEHRTFKGRWIPDVAAHAGFDPGVAMRVLGKPFAGGGTSAATPIWAALVARLAAALGRPLGWLNPALYALAGGGPFHDIREGHNDLRARQGKPVHYRATKGWDPCTGLGTPDGTALLEALQQGPPRPGRGLPRRSSRRK
jgi:kumamolisin